MITNSHLVSNESKNTRSTSMRNFHDIPHELVVTNGIMQFLIINNLLYSVITIICSKKSSVSSIFSLSFPQIMHTPFRSCSLLCPSSRSSPNLSMIIPIEIYIYHIYIYINGEANYQQRFPS